MSELIKFTFHNVSINSINLFLTAKENYNLHSIMYLLIPHQTDLENLTETIFTFHNVSINS